MHFALTLVLAALVVASIFILRRFGIDPILRPALWGVCIATPLILFFWLSRGAAYLKMAPGLAVRGASVYCLTLICLLLLIKTLGLLSGFAAFLIQSLAATVAAVALLASLRLQLAPQPEPSNSILVHQHWQYGRWAVGTQFVYWLSGNAYYVIIAAFLRMQDVAALRALQNFTLPFAQFVAAMSLLLLPWSSARFAEEGGRDFRHRIWQITVLFTGGAFAYYIFLWLFGGTIMGIVYAGQYAQFANLLMLVTAPVVVLAASQGSTIAVRAMQSPAEVFFAYTAAGAVTIIAGVPLTWYWGLRGTAVGMLISNVTFFIVISLRFQARIRAAVAFDAEG